MGLTTGVGKGLGSKEANYHLDRTWSPLGSCCQLLFRGNSSFLIGYGDSSFLIRLTPAGVALVRISIPNKTSFSSKFHRSAQGYIKAYQVIWNIC